MNLNCLITTFFSAGFLIQGLISFLIFKKNNLKTTARIVSVISNDSDTFAEKFIVQFSYSNEDYTAELKTYFSTNKKVSQNIVINFSAKNLKKVKFYGDKNKHFYKNLFINFLGFTIFLYFSLYYAGFF